MDSSITNQSKKRKQKAAKQMQKMTRKKSTSTSKPEKTGLKIKGKHKLKQTKPGKTNEKNMGKRKKKIGKPASHTKKMKEKNIVRKKTESKVAELGLKGTGKESNSTSKPGKNGLKIKGKSKLKQTKPEKKNEKNMGKRKKKISIPPKTNRKIKAAEGTGKTTSKFGPDKTGLKIKGKMEKKIVSKENVKAKEPEKGFGHGMNLLKVQQDRVSPVKSTTDQIKQISGIPVNKNKVPPKSSTAKPSLEPTLLPPERDRRLTDELIPSTLAKIKQKVPQMDRQFPLTSTSHNRGKMPSASLPAPPSSKLTPQQQPPPAVQSPPKQHVTGNFPKKEMPLNSGKIKPKATQPTKRKWPMVKPAPHEIQTEPLTAQKHVSDVRQLAVFEPQIICFHMMNEPVQLLVRNISSQKCLAVKITNNVDIDKFSVNTNIFCLDPNRETIIEVVWLKGHIDYNTDYFGISFLLLDQGVSDTEVIRKEFKKAHQEAVSQIFYVAYRLPVMYRPLDILHEEPLATGLTIIPANIILLQRSKTNFISTLILQNLTSTTILYEIKIMDFMNSAIKFNDQSSGVLRLKQQTTVQLSIHESNAEKARGEVICIYQINHLIQKKDVPISSIAESVGLCHKLIIDIASTNGYLHLIPDKYLLFEEADTSGYTKQLAIVNSKCNVPIAFRLFMYYETDEYCKRITFYDKTSILKPDEATRVQLAIPQEYKILSEIGKLHLHIVEVKITNVKSTLNYSIIINMLKEGPDDCTNNRFLACFTGKQKNEEESILLYNLISEFSNVYPSVWSDWGPIKIRTEGCYKALVFRFWSSTVRAVASVIFVNQSTSSDVTIKISLPLKNVIKISTKPFPFSPMTYEAPIQILPGDNKLIYFILEPGVDWAWIERQHVVLEMLLAKTPKSTFHYILHPFILDVKNRCPSVTAMKLIVEEKEILWSSVCKIPKKINLSLNVSNKPDCVIVMEPSGRGTFTGFISLENSMSVNFVCKVSFSHESKFNIHPPSSENVYFIEKNSCKQLEFTVTADIHCIKQLEECGFMELYEQVCTLNSILDIEKEYESITQWQRHNTWSNMYSFLFIHPDLPKQRSFPCYTNECNALYQKIKNVESLCDYHNYTKIIEENFDVNDLQYLASIFQSKNRKQIQDATNNVLMSVSSSETDLLTAISKAFVEEDQANNISEAICNLQVKCEKLEGKFEKVFHVGKEKLDMMVTTKNKKAKELKELQEELSNLKITLEKELKESTGKLASTLLDIKTQIDKIEKDLPIKPATGNTTSTTTPIKNNEEDTVSLTINKTAKLEQAVKSVVSDAADIRLKMLVLEKKQAKSKSVMALTENFLSDLVKTRSYLRNKVMPTLKKAAKVDDMEKMSETAKNMLTTINNLCTNVYGQIHLSKSKYIGQQKNQQKGRRHVTELLDELIGLVSRLHDDMGLSNAKITLASSSSVETVTQKLSDLYAAIQQGAKSVEEQAIPTAEKSVILNKKCKSLSEIKELTYLDIIAKHVRTIQNELRSGSKNGERLSELLKSTNDELTKIKSDIKTLTQKEFTSDTKLVALVKKSENESQKLNKELLELGNRFHCLSEEMVTAFNKNKLIADVKETLDVKINEIINASINEKKLQTQKITKGLDVLFYEHEEIRKNNFKLTEDIRFQQAKINTLEDNMHLQPRAGSLQHLLHETLDENLDEASDDLERISCLHSVVIIMLAIVIIFTLVLSLRNRNRIAVATDTTEVYSAPFIYYVYDFLFGQRF